MLGKPFVCIVYSLNSALDQSPFADQAWFLQPFLNRNLLYYQLRQFYQAGLDQILLLLDPAVMADLQPIRLAIRGLPLQLNYLEYSESSHNHRVREILSEHFNENDPILFLQNPGLDFVDLQAWIEFHGQAQADCSVRLQPYQESLLSQGHIVNLDADSQIVAADGLNKAKVTPAYLIEADIFEDLLVQEQSLLRPSIFDALVENTQFLSGYISSKDCFKLTSIKDFFSYQLDLLQRADFEPYHYCQAEHEDAKVWLGEDVSLGSGIAFDGPILIGDQVVLQDQLQIQGPCIIGSGSHIQANSKLSQSILWPSCKIGKNTVIQNSFLGQNVTLADKSQVIDLWVGPHSRLNLQQALPSDSVLGAFSQLEINS